VHNLIDVELNLFIFLNYTLVCDVGLKDFIFIIHTLMCTLFQQSEDACLCVKGCGVEESSSHIFFDCMVFHNMWMEILKWLGVSLTLSSTNVSQFFGLEVHHLRPHGCF
jgi:hypothetical protein